MEREIDTLIDYVTSSPPANPDEPVLVPGDRSGWPSRSGWRRGSRWTR